MYHGSKNNISITYFWVGISYGQVIFQTVSGTGVGIKLGWIKTTNLGSIMWWQKHLIFQARTSEGEDWIANFSNIERDERGYRVKLNQEIISQTWTIIPVVQYSMVTETISQSTLESINFRVGRWNVQTIFQSTDNFPYTNYKFSCCSATC